MRRGKRVGQPGHSAATSVTAERSRVQTVEWSTYRVPLQQRLDARFGRRMGAEERHQAAAA